MADAMAIVRVAKLTERMAVNLSEILQVVNHLISLNIYLKYS
jgi:hypothetical protein